LRNGGDPAPVHDKDESRQRFVLTVCVFSRSVFSAIFANCHDWTD
jgi:hypothetical protein